MASNDDRAGPVDGRGAVEEDPLADAVDWLAHYASEAAVASKKLDGGKKSPAPISPADREAALPRRSASASPAPVAAGRGS